MGDRTMGRSIAALAALEVAVVLLALGAEADVQEVAALEGIEITPEVGDAAAEGAAANHHPFSAKANQLLAPEQKLEKKDVIKAAGEVQPGQKLQRRSSRLRQRRRKPS